MHPPDPLAPGEMTPPSIGGHLENALLFGRYRVVRQLGRGGMGLVLLARDQELEVDIAIKLVPDLLVQDQVGLDELKHEVLRGMALTHPGIVRTHGFVRDPAMAAIAMEYVDGGNFNDLRLSHPANCFNTADLLPWLEQLGPVLDYAHFEIKIAHRDLKPHNLMYTRAGRIKVADFGISSTLNDTVSRVSMQRASSGTPAYMSPQQIMGDRPSHLDDVYALGATIYELLTSKPPFYKGHVLAQVLESQPATMTARREEFGITGKLPIPQQWEETVAACLAKEPWQRPQSVGEVIGRLKQSATIHLISKPPTAPVAVSPPARRKRHRHSAAGKWIAGAVVAGLLAFGSAFVVNREAPQKKSAVENRTPPPPEIVSPAVLEPLRITSPDELPSGRVGTRYEYELTASGGTQPYHWSAENPLPEDLTIAETGIISGIPLVAGDSFFGVKVTDSEGVSAEKQVKLVILEKIPPAPEPEPAPLPVVPDPPPSEIAQDSAPSESVIPMIPAEKDHPFENSLGMKFVPAGTPEVLMSIWLTRVADFRAFVEATGHDAKKGVESVEIGGRAGFFHDPKTGDCWETPGFAQGDNHPVSGVSWIDAKAFCEWLTTSERKKGTLPEGFIYRLPTDVEWKNALPMPLVKTGKAIRYPWGAAWPPPAAANFAGFEMRDGGVTPRDWPIISKRDNFPRTSAVDQSPANRFGIHDLYGNLWQFCEEATNPEKTHRLMRGGSWGTFDRDDLDIDRPKGRPAERRVVDAGFRCVIARAN